MTGGRLGFVVEPDLFGVGFLKSASDGIDMLLATPFPYCSWGDSREGGWPDRSDGRPIEQGLVELGGPDLQEEPVDLGT